MSASKFGRFRIAADLASVRSSLLQLFLPRFELVWCQSITWAYDVPASFDFPREPMTAEVYGIHRGDRSEALLVSLDSQFYRRDPNLVLARTWQNLAITLSTKEGVASQWATQQASTGFETLPDEQRPQFTCRLQQRPVWQTREPSLAA